MIRRFLLGVLALTAMAWPREVFAQGVKATVLSIGDGDTIRVRQAGKALTVRLACIDAPETAQGPYGQQARNYLQQRLPVGREVSLEVKTTDRYGRSVAEVISEININLALVEDGQAFAYPSTSVGVTPRSIWTRNTELAGAGTGSGRYRAASPGRGTSGEGAAQRSSQMAPPRAAAVTGAARSAPMPKPRSCCARGITTWTEMMMERHAKCCGAEQPTTSS